METYFMLCLIRKGSIRFSKKNRVAIAAALNLIIPNYTNL